MLVENDFNGVVPTSHTKSSTELKATTSGGLSGSVGATTSSAVAKDSSLSCESDSLYPSSLAEIFSELPKLLVNYLQLQLSLFMSFNRDSLRFRRDLI